MNATRIALTVLLAGLATQSASAQLRYVRPQTNPYNIPTVSPYLNIASGMNPAISYYGIVRPTVQTQQFEQTLVGPGGVLTTQLTTSTGVRPFATGGSSTFMAFGGYFNNINGMPLGRPAPPPGYAAPLPAASPPIQSGGGVFGGGAGVFGVGVR